MRARRVDWQVYPAAHKPAGSLSEGELGGGSPYLAARIRGKLSVCFCLLLKSGSQLLVAFFARQPLKISRMFEVFGEQSSYPRSVSAAVIFLFPWLSSRMISAACLAPLPLRFAELSTKPLLAPGRARPLFCSVVRLPPAALQKLFSYLIRKRFFVIAPPRAFGE